MNPEEITDYLASKGYRFDSLKRDGSYAFADGVTDYGDPVVIWIAPNGDYEVHSR